jgi:hypothetical protein
LEAQRLGDQFQQIVSRPDQGAAFVMPLCRSAACAAFPVIGDILPSDILNMLSIMSRVNLKSMRVFPSAAAWRKALDGIEPGSRF